ncbi:hypothetical protein BCIN_18g00170 [Botrytis cinerea B05.10]|uniref:Uncharacterized protein n=2 Tax=Botryotinia fuckeliana TaxID=40559 RepID=A0A384K7W2_BOTFB|nr:hypothetical protein BCIN_18g00170 [Botrytis cinerea B05.10]ATZ58899.1 hypothetical protein BCIN_18g00170 [Botrytis cinerea B05.10]EMR87697.1 hypothetical protein BcDW1_3661 [Botrytis cinerea BcDW1]
MAALAPKPPPPECMIMGYPVYNLRKGNRFDWNPAQKRNITNFIINNHLKKEQCGKGKKDQIPRSQLVPLFSELGFNEFRHMVNNENESIWEIVEEKIRNRMWKVWEGNGRADVKHQEAVLSGVCMKEEDEERVVEEVVPSLRENAALPSAIPRARQQLPYSGPGSGSGFSSSHILTNTTNNHDDGSMITRLRSNAARGNAGNQSAVSVSARAQPALIQTLSPASTAPTQSTNSNGIQQTQEPTVSNINSGPENSVNPFSIYSEQQREEIRLRLERGRRVQIEDEAEVGRALQAPPVPVQQPQTHDQNYGQGQNAAASVAGENNNGGLVTTVFRTIGRLANSSHAPWDLGMGGLSLSNPGCSDNGNGNGNDNGNVESSGDDVIPVSDRMRDLPVPPKGFEGQQHTNLGPGTVGHQDQNRATIPALPLQLPQNPYSQPSPQNPYFQSSLQNPYFQPSSHNPYSQPSQPPQPLQLPQNPYSQPSSQNPYSQPSQPPQPPQNPYSQPSPQTPYSQPSQPPQPPQPPQNPYSQPSPQNPYFQPSSQNPYSQPSQPPQPLQNPYFQPSSQNPYSQPSQPPQPPQNPYFQPSSQNPYSQPSQPPQPPPNPYSYPYYPIASPPQYPYHEGCPPFPPPFPPAPPPAHHQQHDQNAGCSGAHGQSVNGSSVSKLYFIN